MPTSLKMRGYKQYILNNSVYGRAVGIYENPGGRIVIFVGIICLPLVGIGLKDLTNLGADLPPCPPSSYGPVW